MTNEEKVVNSLKEKDFKFSGLYFGFINLFLCTATCFWFHWVPFVITLCFTAYGFWLHFSKVKEYKAGNPCPLCGHEPEHREDENKEI